MGPDEASVLLSARGQERQRDSCAIYLCAIINISAGFR
jgi:hypothetical protein